MYPPAADWLRILPELIMLGAALLMLIVDLFLPAGAKAGSLSSRWRA